MYGCIVLCLLTASLSPEELKSELEYAQRLRQRHLFRLAELQCRQLLARSDLPKATTAEVTIEFSKCLAAHALNSRPPQRDKLWNESQTVLQEGLKAGATPDSKVRLELQLALTTLMRAEFLRQSAEMTAKEDDRWLPARQMLRTAISQLKQVAEQLRTVEMRNGQSGTLSAPNKESLRRNVSYQLARAYWNQALTYTTHPTDRVNSLTLALEQLDPVATSTAVDDLVWRSRLDRIRCHRLLEQHETASDLISEIREEAPAEFVSQLVAESVRLWLSRNDPRAAARLLDDLEATQAVESSAPELALARIETLVALARHAEEPDAVADYHKQASKLASALATRHGTYWTLRGEMLIASLAEQGDSSNDIELLNTAARSYLQRDLPDDAAEMFIQAARNAEAAGKDDDAFEFRYQAAAVDHQRRRLQPAIDRLRDVALKYPTQAKAPDAHLLGVLDAAELYRQHASQGVEGQQALEQYRGLLEEHLSHWPDSETADQARLWLGRLLQATHRWEAAIEQYQAVRLSSRHVRERDERLGETFDQALSLEKPAKWLAVARAWYDEYAKTTREANASPQAVHALVASARLYLLYKPTDYLKADASLRAAQTLSPDDSANARLIHALLSVTAAGRSQHKQAEQELAQAVPLPPKELAEMLRGLQCVFDQSHTDTERLLALMTSVAKLIVTYHDDLPASDQQVLEETIADAMAKSEPEKATAAYARLAKASPRNSRVQRRYAELLALQLGTAAREAALAQWRLVVRQSAPRSTDWFRGKLGVATAHYHLRNRQQAREMIELLMSLYPEMGGPELKRDFMHLLQRCKT